LQIIAGRRERLQQERAALPVPDTAEYELKQETLAELRERIAEAQEEVANASRICRVRPAAPRDHGAVQHVQKERAEAHARRAALEQLQKRVQGDGKLGDWLHRHRIDNRHPLWKSLHVEAGWEDAVEAVLRERLSALPVEWSIRPGARTGRAAN
jgi:chromosome segregation protein